jgi:transcriptional regulator with PAS, ATPase and Fis domain
VVRLSLPLLCERREDIPHLIEHFIQRFNVKLGKKITGVTPAVMDLLMRHEFPGNVRELENIIEYAFVLCRTRMIDTCHLPEHVLHGDTENGGANQADNGTGLERAEADAVRAALAKVDGHVSAAAKDLGISRTTLWRKMRKYGIATNGR